MYVSKENALEIPFDFKTYMAKAEEIALINSGCHCQVAAMLDQ
jgi:hypothetical protein